MKDNPHAFSVNAGGPPSEWVNGRDSGVDKIKVSVGPAPSWAARPKTQWQRHSRGGAQVASIVWWNLHARHTKRYCFCNFSVPT